MPNTQNITAKEILLNTPMLKKTECYQSMDSLKASSSTRQTLQDLRTYGKYGVFASNVNHAVKVRLGVVETQLLLSLSESGKQDYTPSRYSAVRGKVLDCLHFVCGVDWVNNELQPGKKNFMERQNIIILVANTLSPM
jgi:hypothetical protein